MHLISSNRKVAVAVLSVLRSVVSFSCTENVTVVKIVSAIVSRNSILFAWVYEGGLVIIK